MCDRFMDSTRAYQGYAGGCDFRLIDELERGIVGATRPDMTLIFDLDPQGPVAARATRWRRPIRAQGSATFTQSFATGFLAIAAT